MGERKGTNKYYPPDFDPKKHRSLDAYHGTHALRERARKLHEGILIIRFEMPYNIWCEGCKNPIGMGVRYNAEKSKIGMYYTTPIYKFRMKCHLCDNHFEIKTDPANHDYVIIEGARRKEQRWDPKENEQVVTEDKSDQKKMATDAMFKIEHGVQDKNKSKKAIPGISQLTAIREQWKDDYDLNKLVRSQFREKKKLMKSEAERDEALLKRSSLDIKLVPENSADRKMAELLKYRTVISFQEKKKEKREEINNRSIFASPSPLGSPSSTPHSSSGSSDSSEGGISKEQLKHKEAHNKLIKIATKHKSPFSTENIKIKVGKIDGNMTRSLGIICKPKTAQCLPNPSQENLSEAQRTSDTEASSDEKYVNNTQLPSNTESNSDSSIMPAGNNQERTVDTICTSKSEDNKEGTDTSNVLMQVHALQKYDSNIEDDIKSVECAANGANALNSLMSTYTDSSGESD